MGASNRMALGLKPEGLQKSLAIARDTLGSQHLYDPSIEERLQKTILRVYLEFFDVSEELSPAVIAEVAKMAIERLTGVLPIRLQ